MVQTTDSVAPRLIIFSLRFAGGCRHATMPRPKSRDRHLVAKPLVLRTSAPPADARLVRDEISIGKVDELNRKIGMCHIRSLDERASY